MDKNKDRMCFTTPQSYMAAQGGVVKTDKCGVMPQKGGSILNLI